MKRSTKSIAAAALAAVAGAAGAQGSVTLYGDIDQYGNYMKSSSGNHIVAIDDGALLRSRWGMRGSEDLGGGYAARFTLEGGFSGDTGGLASTGLFDRQSYIGLVTPAGEFRVGRQNSTIFVHGGYIDFTQRTLGSVVNAFGVPARFDNDMSYISKRVSNLQLEAHVALPEAPGNHALVYQLGLDYATDNYNLGYQGLRGRPVSNAPIDKDVVYDNLYADLKYGGATVYLAYIHSNNITSSAVSTTAGTIVANIGGYNTGTNADLKHFYNIYQVSADYQLSPQLRVGALWGRIQDTSGRDQGASGAAIGAYYDLSKRTTLLALVDTLRNDANGGFRPAGSAALKANFTSPGDVTGRTISGLQVGFVVRF